METPLMLTETVNLAPELLEHLDINNINNYKCAISKASDIYSFGLVIIELITRKAPFEEYLYKGKPILEKFKKEHITTGLQGKILEEIYLKLKEVNRIDLFHVIKNSLLSIPEERILIAEVLKIIDDQLHTDNTELTKSY